MNGIFRFVSFGLGACLATLAMRAVAEAASPDPRATLEEGIRAWLTIADAAGAAQAEFDAFQAEVRAQTDEPTSVQARRSIAVEPPA